MSAPPSDSTGTPTADLVPARGRSLLWIVPALAAGLALLLAYQAYGKRGPRLTVCFQEGHGIKAGDQLRYRGIAVGEIDDVELSDDLAQVVLHLRLDERAQDVARAGSRFWVVRPDFSIQRVAGIETIVGARYLAVLPGPVEAARETQFVGLEQPPVLERFEPGGLEIALRADARHGLLPGAPLSYRQIQIGSVLSVELSSDATTIELRAYVRPEYTSLVREDSRFWEVSGIDIDLGMGGLKVQFESVRSVLIGGIAMATPDPPGQRVESGHGFELFSEVDDDWLEWSPALPVGSALSRSLPQPARVTATLSPSRLFGRKQRRAGWVLYLENGLLGPVDLLRPPGPPAARDGGGEPSFALELEDERLSLPERAEWQQGGLCLMDVKLEELEVWPAGRMRALKHAEDCLVVGDPSAASVPLSGVHLVANEAGWAVDRSVALDEAWHGACVVACSDGALVGVLLIEARGARIALLP